MERSTIYGPVVGVDESAHSGAHAWKGVPFARPPVGALRWRAPAAPDAWTAPRAAQAFGPASVQTGRIYGPGLNNRYDRSIGTSLGATTGAEDCLYLNIWAPAGQSGQVGKQALSTQIGQQSAQTGQPAAAAAPGTLLPVIVFVHGGSNITGYTADPLYDGGHLAAHANAVVVTVNYRLGIFGFLNLAQLKTGVPADDSGNFALLDILAALEFIKQNIASFGGDPGNVTLMGQSAGAVNILSLLASPLLMQASPALVHRAVPISGGLSLPADLAPGRIAALQPLVTREAQGKALLRQALIHTGEAADAAAADAWVNAHSDAQAADWLRAASADSLLDTVLTRLTPLGLAGAGPIADGHVLPQDPVTAMRAGAYLKVPVLCGLTRDEGKLFPAALAMSPLLGGVAGRLLDDASVFALQFDYQADAPAQTTLTDWIPAQYLPVDAPATGFDARTRVLGDLAYTPNRDLLLDLLRAQQAEVWHYRFDWDEQPAPFDAIYGAAHGFDVPFIFGNFGPSLFGAVMTTQANAPGRLALAEAMMNSVAAFAHHGNPNHASLGRDWPAWPATLLFDASPATTAISVVDRAALATSAAATSTAVAAAPATPATQPATPATQAGVAS